MLTIKTQTTTYEFDCYAELFSLAYGFDHAWIHWPQGTYPDHLEQAARDYVAKRGGEFVSVEDTP